MQKLLKKQSGQGLLVIILIMFVGLTVSLTLISRTTTDIKLARQLEESSRALAAAEAGIEEELRGAGVAGQQTIVAGVTYEVVTPTPGEIKTGVFSLDKIERENAGTVWFINHDTSGNPDLDTKVYGVNRIRLCWKKADTSAPKIEAIILYKEGTDYKVARGFYDPSGVVGAGEDCGDPDDSVYPNKTDVFLPSGPTIILLALRLKPIGDDAFVAVDPPEGVADNSLPSQGEEFTSTGRVGDVIRKVRAVRSYSSWPEIFDYVLFSGGGLTK